MLRTNERSLTRKQNIANWICRVRAEFGDVHISADVFNTNKKSKTSQPKQKAVTTKLVLNWTGTQNKQTELN